MSLNDLKEKSLNQLNLRKKAALSGLGAVFGTILVKYNLAFGYEIEVSYAVLGFIWIAFVLAGLSIFNRFITRNIERKKDLINYSKTLMASIAGGLITAVALQMKSDPNSSILSLSYWFEAIYQVAPVLLFGAFFYVFGGKIYLHLSEEEQKLAES